MGNDVNVESPSRPMIHPYILLFTCEMMLSGSLVRSLFRSWDLQQLSWSASAIPSYRRKQHRSMLPRGLCGASGNLDTYQKMKLVYSNISDFVVSSYIDRPHIYLLRYAL
ncbi:hypothetical protein PVAP13_7NG348125 [Panicum virgatum]|uniref:Uncharacterized protein n=1 Tax=Panicum virgatum TaxID=38727 RepID=A0A8T0Q1Z8_PANVG|nr:hypothetical protein PVAP13_7NG348125 [Panicum virgatum]